MNMYTQYELSDLVHREFKPRCAVCVSSTVFSLINNKQTKSAIYSH